MSSYNHKISDQSKVKFNPVSRELENTESGLPAVTSSDEGKVLTVNSSGEWVADEPSEELPAVTSSDEGKVLTVNSSGEWVAANPSGIPYSTSEVKIGEMDGKGVYQKTFEVADIDPGNTKFVAHTGLTSSNKILNIFGTTRSYYLNNIDMITPIFCTNQSVIIDRVSLDLEGTGDLAIHSTGTPIEDVTYSAIITIVYVKNNS